jgi:hypothetical protein
MKVRRSEPTGGSVISNSGSGIIRSSVSPVSIAIPPKPASGAVLRAAAWMACADAEGEHKILVKGEYRVNYRDRAGSIAEKFSVQ